MAGRTRNITVSEASRPILPRHAKLKFDRTRQVWVLLAPVRVLAPDEIAVEVLRLCAGVHNVEQRVDHRVARFSAVPRPVSADFDDLLLDYADSGFLAGR